MTGGPALASTDSKAGSFLYEKLRQFEGRLAEAEERVAARQQDDADAVHDLRVALRRTRTVLELGRPVLGRFHANEVRLALRDVQRATGALRDEEVLLELIGSLGVTTTNVEHWLGVRRRRERRLRNGLNRLIGAGAIRESRRLLDALLAFRVKPSRDRRVTKLARRAVDDARREVEKRRGGRVDDAQAMHVLRIAYKRLRYTIETFAEVLPDEVVAQGQQAARMQNRLGQLHDADMAIACVTRARALSHAGREALLAGLARARAERAAACEQELGAPRGSVSWVRYAVGGDGLRKISTR